MFKSQPSIPSRLTSPPPAAAAEETYGRERLVLFSQAGVHGAAEGDGQGSRLGSSESSTPGSRRAGAGNMDVLGVKTPGNFWSLRWVLLLFPHGKGEGQVLRGGAGD